ncbi:hypothetical protein [Gilvibacter sp.]|uniref:hypothetical protein n=1 Tax=Gilvibacter sp. TaxID=2729997 RepID=UPI003F4A0C21
MKRIFKTSTILVLLLGLIMASCSREENQIEEVETSLEIEQTEAKRGLTTVGGGSCNGLGFLEINEFDGDYDLGEQVLIIWDATLCGGTIPDVISVYYSVDGGLPIYHSIVSSIDPYFESVPGASIIGNFLWDVTGPALNVGGNYTMYLQNEDNGTIMSTHQFTISGTTAPQNCDFGLTDELDGDYRIRFYVDNNNECFTNVRYEIDYGDGDSTSFVSNNNTFSFAHQYPFGTYGVYNVNVVKKDNATNQVLSSKTISVTAKRD